MLETSIPLGSQPARSLRAAGLLGTAVVHFGVLSLLFWAPPHKVLPTSSRGDIGLVHLVTVDISHAHSTSITANDTRIAAPDGKAARVNGALHVRNPTIVPSNGRTDAHGIEDTAQLAGEQLASLPSSTNTSISAIGLDYQRQLEDHLATFQRANSSGRAGVVYVLFEIDRSGLLKGVWVTRSSGNPVLDAEAVDTVRRAVPLPPIPEQLPDPITITLPISFYLL